MEGYLALIKKQREENDKLKETYETSVEHLQEELRKQRKVTKYYLNEYTRLNGLNADISEELERTRKSFIEYQMKAYKNENIINGLEKYIIDEENENNKLLISKITSQIGKEKIKIENVIYDDILDELRKLKEK